MTSSASRCASIPRGAKTSLAPANLQCRFDTLAEESAGTLRKEISDLVMRSTTNLVTKNYLLKELQNKIASLSEPLLQQLTTEIGRPLSLFETQELQMSVRDLQDMLEKDLTPIVAEISDKKQELYLQMKWLRLGFPRKALDACADGVQFLMRTGFAFSIAMFMDTTAKGTRLHEIRLHEGTLEVRMEGEHKPWTYIKTLLEVNRDNQAVSIHNSSDVYTYISPDGIVKKSRTPNELYPIEQLDHEELESLKDHARSFWENSPNTPVECVFQIVTTEVFCFTPSWLTNGLNEVNQKRTSIRLIDEEGKVYSCGLEASKELKEYVKDHGLAGFTTGHAKIGTPDYRDTFDFDVRLITNIPLTRASLQNILQLVQDINTGQGTRFCLTKQNCNTFGIVALELAGITVESRTTPGELLLRMVPKLETIPVVGGVLSWIRKKVASIVNPIFSLLSKLTPAPVTKAYSYTVWALTYVPRKIGTVALNSTMLLLGAGKEAEPVSPGFPTNEPINPHQMISFSSLIPTWKDIFDDTKSQIYHPCKLIDWQKEQRSTIRYGTSRYPTMHLLHK